ncbi:germination protein YpeB [Calderihabitans maritimus]|uniref:Spore germination YpeB n=1 Tax=Calderihabitans maritimus TaxID=1246530 RepID=A0A1Z5HQ45_9FIRM|nr:germination protein YpeB [Calderihabitans maritimus]GAW91634.1 spore germination YpeB [Calderihabitans maritimus]
MKKKRWTGAALLTALLLISLASVGFWGYQQYQARTRLQTLLNNKYQRAFYELINNVENLQILLAKGLVSGSPDQNVILFTDIWYEANSAQSNLNQLPLGQPVISRTAKFLTQTGDYALALVKQQVTGRPVGDKDWLQLEELHARAVRLTQELHELENKAARGLLAWSEIQRNLPRKLPKGGPAPAPEEFRSIEEEVLKDLPTLIYDGPFADHIQRRQPQGLTGEKISREEARKTVREIALRFADVPNQNNWMVRLTGTVSGVIPAYSVEMFSPGAPDGQKIIMDISQTGGHVVWMVNTRSIAEASLSTEEALQRAKKFLAERGFKNMVPTYSSAEQNVATIAFAYKQNEVVIYPDLIKVQVALDNGQVIGFESLGYLMAHRPRELPQPRITEEEAARFLNPRLKIENSRLAVIPLETKKEVLCYEFKGRLNTDTFLIYINALTGEEEKILQLVNTPNGKLTL